MVGWVSRSRGIIKRGREREGGYCSGSHLNACSCSQLLASQMRTVASLLQLMTWLPSAEYIAPLTYEVCPLNSLSILPDLRPWTRTVPSNEDERTYFIWGVDGWVGRWAGGGVLRVVVWGGV